MDPVLAAHRHSASKTRVNALVALRCIRGTNNFSCRQPSQHLMHIDLDAVGVSCADADEQVLHQPAVVFGAGFEFGHRTKIDQCGIDNVALAIRSSSSFGPKRMPTFSM